jgi:DNA-binding NtrC family response regulator
VLVVLGLRCEVSKSAARALARVADAELGCPETRASDSMLSMPAFGAVPAASSSDISLPGNLPLEEAERRYAMAVLEREGGNQSAAARALNISRNRLARLLKPG